MSRPFISTELILVLSIFSNLNATNIQPTITSLDQTTKKIDLAFNLEPNDFIYKEYINCSTDHPDITLHNYHYDNEPLMHYDSTFKDTKKIFKNNFTLSMNAKYESPEPIDKSNLRVTYYSHNRSAFCESIIPIIFNENNNTSISTVENISYENKTTPPPVAKSTLEQKKRNTISNTWRGYLTNLLKTTEKPWMRIILVFLLGLLLSLTPCIYPMIPITIGILQAQARKSMISNFMTAFLYTLGLSTTFAILGLLTAFAGQQIGSLLVNPWIIMLMVCLLVYVALSLFDIYELYIPRFLQKQKNVYTGSFVSVFIFGMISGTIASPCISPGLILVLTIVASLKNLFLGFLLLFVFGLGLTFPLLIIGTFSTAITLLPQAGEWMIEIKHVLGFILFGMCFYFLNFILPWHILLGLIAIFVFIVGIFYLYQAQKMAPGLGRTIKMIIGLILIGSSVFFATKGLQAAFITKESQQKLVK